MYFTITNAACLTTHTHIPEYRNEVVDVAVELAALARRSFGAKLANYACALSKGAARATLGKIFTEHSLTHLQLKYIRYPT